MKIIEGGNYSYARGVSYPIHIKEDTTFRGSNFHQQFPHTPIFKVEPGVRLVLEDVNAVNVTLPDELAPDDFSGNNAQIVPTETGNPDRPTVNLLHECDKCATAVVALRKMIASKAKVGRVDGKWRLVRMKSLFRARRLDPDLVAADMAALAHENAQALAKWTPAEDTPAAPVVADTTVAEQTWWQKVKAFFGFGE